MGDLITVSDLEVRDGEPRVQDLALARALGFANAHQVRPLIKRHLSALKAFGEVSPTWEKPGSKGGRPSQVFYLNEEQAIFITAKSDTPRAAEITVEMVRVFRAYLKGEVRPVAARQALSAPRADARITALEAQVKMLMESAVTMRELYGVAMGANIRVEKGEETGFGKAFEGVTGDLVTRASGGVASGKTLMLLHRDHERKRGAFPEIKSRPRH